jgi:hypothetical protein
MYKGIGRGVGTTSGIINADQTRRGEIRRLVWGKGKEDPDLQMCGGGEEGRELYRQGARACLRPFFRR